MSFSVYYIFYALLNILSTYVVYHMIRIFNGGRVKSKKLEIFLYIIFYFANLFISITIDIPSIILMITITFFFIISLNYNSNFLIKIYAVFSTMLLAFLSEVIVVLFLDDNFTSPTEISREKIHIILSMKIVEFVTLIFVVGIDGYRKNKRKFTIWYIPLVILMLIVYVDSVFQQGSLQKKKMLLDVLIVFYMLSSLVFLYILQQMQIRKERRLLQQEIDNYHNQYNLLKVSSHAILELHHNLETHFIVMGEMAKDNEKLLAYMNNFMDSERNQDEFINTGNLTIDSILNVKFKEAQSLGIEVNHEIVIPENINIDYFDMAIILGNLLNCAIKEVRYHKNKILNFIMRYDKGRVFIYLIHSNEVSEVERKKHKYIYPDDISMRSVERAVKIYSGDFDSKIDEEKVIVSVLMFVESRNET